MVVVVLAANVKAETILETFDGALTGWTTSGTQLSATQTAGVQGKYMDITWSTFGTAQQSRFSKALSGSYNQDNSIWLEMDIIHETCLGTQEEGYFAAMKSGDTSNEKNMVGDRLFYDFTASPETTANDRGNRHDAYFYAADGSEIKMGSTTPGTYPHLEDTATGYRVKFFYDGSAKTIQMAIYAINSDGSTGTKQYDSAVSSGGATSISTGGKLFAFDSFGLANRTNNTKQIPSQSMQIDNLFISTDGANASPTAPSWIPEPTTVALLGLGALIFRKRK